MTRRGLGGAVSFPRHIGVTAKLGLAFAALLVVLATYGVVFGLAIHRLRSKIADIAEVAQPMSAAAFEREINAVGAGLGVMKYLHRPDLACRERFEEDRAKFGAFLERYRRLGRDERHMELTAKVDSLFQEYDRVGSDLLESGVRSGRHGNRVHPRCGADTQATVVSALRFLVAAGAVGALISVLAIAFLSKHIMGPVRRLSESADIISSGDLGHRIGLDRRDEIGQLAGSFNSMAERLEKACDRSQ